MQFWKDHKALRFCLILVFFLAGVGLVIGGWMMSGKLLGLLLMLLGVALLLTALFVYNKPFEEPKSRKRQAK